MDTRSFPTKGNLMLAKNTLSLVNLGYSLMDRKRNILIREIMNLISESQSIQGEIDKTFTYAYQCLQKANIEMGIYNVYQVAQTIPIEDTISIKSRSVMGTEISLVTYTPDENKPSYSFGTTRESFDQAREAFRKVKELTVRLSTVENEAYRLAVSIKKTQKRANALKNIMMPYYSGLVTEISNALEEKDREEFTRLKVIKRRKQETSSLPV